MSLTPQTRLWFWFGWQTRTCLDGAGRRWAGHVRGLPPGSSPYATVRFLLGD
ncbi:hypothetical protein LY78DRAFT_662993 [Colletotrichum sublineola]|nr:hypothetical protein LY78DRAFT_662993 [Colletotrichum sublineola]